MPTIHYIYSAHSAYAYLGSKALYDICARHNVTLIHKPILLSPVVEAQGSMPFRERTQAHVDYFFGREIERWAELRNVPIVNFRPTYHDADYTLASGMILALGAQGPEVDAMAHAILEAHWRDDADLSNPSTLAQIAVGQGHDAQRLIAMAASNEVQSQLTANSDQARENAVFGSPTYILDGDSFYGQDRLELVERAVKQPFKPSHWVNPPVN
ncbi:MAG: 2-hydroxychromene-2-carboxylate isomerase [Aliishimia sp.]